MAEVDFVPDIDADLTLSDEHAERSVWLIAQLAALLLFIILVSTTLYRRGTHKRRLINALFSDKDFFHIKPE